MFSSLGPKDSFKDHLSDSGMAGSRSSSNAIRYLSPSVLFLILTKAFVSKGRDGHEPLQG